MKLFLLLGVLVLAIPFTSRASNWPEGSMGYASSDAKCTLSLLMETDYTYSVILDSTDDNGRHVSLDGQRSSGFHVVGSHGNQFHLSNGRTLLDVVLSPRNDDIVLVTVKGEVQAVCSDLQLHFQSPKNSSGRPTPELHAPRVHSATN